MRRPKTSIHFASLLLALALTAASSVVGGAPAETIRSVDEGLERRVVYSLGERDVTVHRTTDAVGDLRVETMAEIGTIAARWNERGKTGERDMVSISRSGGLEWSRPQALTFDIALRGERFDPRRRASAIQGELAARESNRIFIVQFETMSLSPMRRRLEQLGAELLLPVPEHAQLVRIDADGAALLEQESFVRWVGPFHPAYRMEPGVLDAEPGDPPRRFVLQVYTSGLAAKQPLIEQIEALGGEVVKLTPNGYWLEALLVPQQVEALLHSNHLAWIERWHAPEDDVNNAREDTGANFVETVDGYDGTGVVGEVMDSGIYLPHQDFDGLLFHGPAADDSRHGTNTTGIVFGNGDRDGDGDPLATGLLPGATAYFADYNELGDRFAHTGELVADPINAVFQSNSWGTGRTLFYTSLSAQMDDIIWTHDIAIFQSQSNAADQYSRPQAWAKNVISVGGSEHFNTLSTLDDCWCEDSSIGPAFDGRVKPDLVHWADNIYTTDHPTLGVGLYRPDFGGTSAATPIVAGTSGLFFQMWADDILGNNPAGTTVFEKRPHATTAKALMINTADAYPFSGFDHDHTRSHQGWGRPSARRFHERAPLMQVIDEEVVLEELEFASYLASVPNGQAELKVTLVFADRAGTPFSLIHRVNDLSLRVTSPSGTPFWGNVGLESGLFSNPGGAPNTVDTVENVFILAPEEGDWKIEVFADEIAMDQHVETAEDDSDFALVVYGVTALDDCRDDVAVPSGLAGSPNGDNRIDLSWSGSAAGYRVLRAIGGCDGEFESIAQLGSTEFSHADTTASGGITYGYVVRGSESCDSADSNCVEVTTTGPCLLEPSFGGLEAVRGTPGPTCGIRLDWSAATARCGGEIRYNVYRSTSSHFTPSDANRVALCLDDVTYQDQNGLIAAQRYYYTVRAEDLAAEPAGVCGGLEEPNSLEQAIEPQHLASYDFESGYQGWTTDLGEPIGADTGDFVPGDPIGTYDVTDPAQPEDDHTLSGTQCMYTAPNPWGNIGSSDVDGGEVRATSPVFDATGFSGVRLSLWRWHYNRDLDVADILDYFRVDVTDDGDNWVTMHELDSAESVNEWTLVNANLGSFVSLTDTMQIRVRSSDGGSAGNVIESAFDDLALRRGDACSADLVPPGVITHAPDPLSVDRAGLDLHLNWGPDCGSGTRFGIYRGEISTGYGSAAPLPGFCDVAALSAVIPADTGSYFYLVTPNTGTDEGSLGLDSAGSPAPNPHPSATPEPWPPAPPERGQV